MICVVQLFLVVAMIVKISVFSCCTVGKEKFISTRECYVMSCIRNAYLFS